jgi:predicted transcriptional regulator
MTTAEKNKVIRAESGLTQAAFTKLFGIPHSVQIPKLLSSREPQQLLIWRIIKHVQERRVYSARLPSGAVSGIGMQTESRAE